MSDHPQATLPSVVIVDDEAQTVSNFRLALSGLFQVHSATDPREALVLIENPGVKIVLTDYFMDGMTGIELVREIKNLRPDIVCILFSGNLTEERWTAAINAGSRHVLQKPIPLKPVIELCASIVGCPAPATPQTTARPSVQTPSWRGALGQNLQSLGNFLQEGLNPLFLVTPDGNFPEEFISLQVPSLIAYPSSPDGEIAEDAVHYARSLQTAPVAVQNEIAQALASRRNRRWLLAADATPDELIDRQVITEKLYLRLNQTILRLPAPGEIPADTLLLCDWWLSSLPTPASLSGDGGEWLANQLDHFNWDTLIALLKQALRQKPGQPIDAACLQRAAVTVSLGSDFAGIQYFSEFADEYINDLQKAWSLLGATPP